MDVKLVQGAKMILEFKGQKINETSVSGINVKQALDITSTKILNRIQALDKYIDMVSYMLDNVFGIEGTSKFVKANN